MSAFNGPRLKIERGKRHIEELRGEVSRFLAEQPYRLVVEADTDPAFQRLVLDNVTAFPKEIPLILGDAIHNLRAALDHLACILVRENGQPDNDVYFPVVKNAAALPARLHSAKIDRAAADVVDMVRALNPYPGGNDYIPGLHHIDIVDKHRLLIAVGHVISNKGPLSSFIVRGSTITLIPDANNRQVVESGAIFAKIPTGPQLKPGDRANASFEIAFGAETAFPGEPVVPMLNEIVEYLEKVIDTFESYCVEHKRVSAPVPLRQRSDAVLRIR